MGRAQNRAKARERRRDEKRRYQGHPASIAARKKQDGPPDARELELRKITRLVREEARNPAEGPLVGPLAAAAKYAAPILAQRHGLDDDENRAAITNFLVEQLGDVIDDFDVAAYGHWRRACVGAEV